MMVDAGTWGTLCGFFSPAVTPAALLPPLSRASSASVTLQSPGRGKSCSRGLALEETVAVMEPKWWTRIGCMLELGKSFTSIQRPSWQQDCS